LAAGSADPWCFASNGGDSEYEVVGGVGAAATTVLHPAGPAASSVFTATLVQTAATMPVLGPDTTRLDALADASCSDVFRLRLTPAAGDVESAAYSVPPALFAGGLDPSPCPAGPPAYAASVKHAPFGVHVAAAGDPGDAGAPLFDTTGHRLVVKRRYVEWTTALHPASTVRGGVVVGGGGEGGVGRTRARSFSFISIHPHPPFSQLYGLGERTGSLVVDRGSDGDASQPPPRPRTIWTRDRPAWAPGENLYGAWPAWMEVLPSGSARGGLVVSGTALDVLARPGSLSFRATGGGIDVFIFAGPSPAHVMDQLTRVVGRPSLPPAWALGVHQSRWGYHDASALAAVVDCYEAAGIPLDVVWSDIDAMRGRRDFTLSPTRYPVDAVRGLVRRLHDSGRRWVPIVDPGIKIESGYAPYDDGLAAGVFVRAPGSGGGGGGGGGGSGANTTNTTTTPFTGRVWPGAVHYPDFVAPGNATADWWGAFGFFFCLGCEFQARPLVESGGVRGCRGRSLDADTARTGAVVAVMETQAARAEAAARPCGGGPVSPCSFPIPHSHTLLLHPSLNNNRPGHRGLPRPCPL
jgi:alpha-D-xyloside xylohydrolase